MTWYPLAFLPPQYDDGDGVPYSGAVLKAYRESTSTVIPMATSYEGTTLSSSISLNEDGYPVFGSTIIIPHVQENYDLALYPDQASADANSGALWTVPNIQIADTENDAFFQSFSGDGTTVEFTLSEDLGTDEKTIMVFADLLDELVTNGDFDSDEDWTKGTGWTIADGVAKGSSTTDDLEQNAAILIHEGESYTLTFTVSDYSSGTITPYVGGTAGTGRTANGTYTETIIAGSTQLITFTGTSTFTGNLDDVSLTRENSSQRKVFRPDEYTLENTTLTLYTAPQSGTKNVLVFAPSLLFGAVGAAAAAAATSEANAAASAAAASTSETNAAASETNAATSETNAATSETNAATSETNAANSEAAAIASADVMKYTFSSNTAMADPGQGILRLNNATLANVTAIAIDDEAATAGNPDVSAFIASFANSTNTVKGRLQIRKSGTPATFVIYEITAVTDNSGWSQLTVTHLDSNGTLSDTDTLIISFTRSGDAGAGLAAVVNDPTPQLGGFLDANSNQIRQAKGANVSSASTLTLGNDGNSFDITGTTTITSIATKGVGTMVVLQFNETLTLTHHATDLILPGGANITTAAGDVALFYEYATGDWRCMAYTTYANHPGGGGIGDFLGSIDASNVTSIDIGESQDLDITIDDTYDVYKFEVVSLQPINDGIDLWARLGNGGVFDTSGYRWGAIQQLFSSAASPAGDGRSSAAQIQFHIQGIGNGATEGVDGMIFYLYNPANTSKYSSIQGFLKFSDASGDARHCYFSGERSEAAAHDIIQLYCSSGNITAKVNVYGMKIA